MKLKLKLLFLCSLYLAHSYAQEKKKESNRTTFHCGSMFTGNYQPLIILNGMDILGGYSIDIKPDDVVNVRILKGQEAIDAYGERGKNGAILYTLRIKMNLICSEEILQAAFRDSLCKNRKLIFRPISGNDVVYDYKHPLYFEKNKVTIKTSEAGEDCVVVVEQH